MQAIPGKEPLPFPKNMDGVQSHMVARRQSRPPMIPIFDINRSAELTGPPPLCLDVKCCKCNFGLKDYSPELDVKG